MIKNAYFRGYYVQILWEVMGASLLRRKLPMAWGTTTDKVNIEINPFQIWKRNKHLTLKNLETYLIPDG